MKLRNILIAAATMGVMFASSNSANIVGYSAGDYSDMNYFPHKASGLNVAFTSGGADSDNPESFNTVWTDGGTTWGFAGGADDELVNMRWANSTMGLSLGLTMDSDTDVGTTMDIGFGMGFGGWDVGFHMGTADGDGMALNARGNLGFWAFDTMEITYASDDDNSYMGARMYGLNDWGAATGMFSMGFVNTDLYAWGGTEAASYLTTGFSVASTLTNWCDLRIGYTKMFNVGAEEDAQESADEFLAGVGFDLGSVKLDMTLSDLSAMVSNPLNYLNGRNETGLTTEWTLTYTW